MKKWFLVLLATALALTMLLSGCGNGEELLYDGFYQYAYPDCTSYLRFFPDGKVVSATSTGTPEQVARWLDHEYEENGVYTIEDGVLKFTITSSNGQVSYTGKILDGSIEMDVISYINGNISNDRVYDFVSLK